MGFDPGRRRFLGWATGLVSGALGVGSVSGRAAAAAPGGMPGALAWEVHQATRNTRVGALGNALWPTAASSARAKPYPELPRIELPPPPPHARSEDEPDAASQMRGFAPASALAATAIPLDELARLLHLAYGVTDGSAARLRAAPSAGALYAGEVYVVAAGVEGLPAGVYSYHAPSHTLVRLASGPQRRAVATTVERPGALERAPAIVLLTNVFHRYARRYRNRGYRYALIDSGHIGENLRLAARARGLDVVTPLRFHDDALNALLGVDGRAEAVCALHALGTAVSDTPARVRGLVEAGAGADDGEQGVVQRFHAATRLVPGTLPRREASAPARPPTGSTGPVQGLPEAATPAAGVIWSIRERRSARRFREEPLSQAQLAALLAMARGSEAARLVPELELRLVVHRVAGLAPGVYRHDPSGARLEGLRAGDLRDDLRRACLRQEKASSAAVGCAMVADLGRALARGDRAYRDLLLEAGCIGQRLYLGAESLGVAARNLAAFLDDSLNDLLAVEPGREAVVHLTMLGPGD